MELSPFEPIKEVESGEQQLRNLEVKNIIS